MSNVRRWMVDETTYVVNADDYDALAARATEYAGALGACHRQIGELEAWLMEAKRLLLETVPEFDANNGMGDAWRFRRDAFLADQPSEVQK